jgi:hypothetical protein
VPLVDDRVSHTLADQVRADRKTLKPVFFENVFAALDISVILHRLVGIEVIAPAGQLKAVVAEAFGFLRHDLKRQVSPLAGKYSDWSSHNVHPFVV